jgi:hypothetical protein
VPHPWIKSTVGEDEKQFTVVENSFQKWQGDAMLILQFSHPTSCGIHVMDLQVVSGT